MAVSISTDLCGEDVSLIRALNDKSMFYIPDLNVKITLNGAGHIFL